MSIKTLQQRYQLLVNGVDVTADVSGDILWESTPDVVTSLSFNLKGNRFIDNTGALGMASATFKDVIKMFDRVEFSGGAGILDDLNYAPLFRGFVKYIRPQYPNNGSLFVSVECVDYSFRGAIASGYFAYPSRKSDRKWAEASSLKPSVIVQNLAKEIGLSLGDIRIAYDQPFTLTRPLTQRNETDWQILRKLAKQLNCNVWTTFQDNGGSTLNFVDKSYLLDDSNQGEFQFLYPIRSGSEFVYREKKDSYIILTDVSVEQDFTEMSATRRTVTTFDYAKGEEVTIFEATIQENGKPITKYFTFEIDETKTRSLDPTQRAQLELIAGSLAGEDDSPYNINDIAKYFKPATFYDDRRRFVVDKPYYGITVNATCDGNVNIVPRKTYKVLGIGRFGSESLEQNLYLRTVRHRWGSRGFLTELEFMR
jgi:hypothetical protein